MGVTVIVNIKPWLLEVHPMLYSAEEVSAFIRSAEDAKGDGERESEGGSAKSWVWSSGFGAQARGRYFDFSSQGGSRWWGEKVREMILEMGLSGVW